MENNKKPHHNFSGFKSERKQVHDWYTSRGANPEDLEFTDYDRYVNRQYTQHNIDMRVESPTYNGPFSVFKERLQGLPPESATDQEREHIKRARKLTDTSSHIPQTELQALSVFDEFSTADPTNTTDFLTLNKARLFAEEEHPLASNFMEEGDEYHLGHS